ncbi:MAG: MGMT family protein [Saprospiraceae bacterium]|uniref:MGMT family protein n=1 Tax=Candidatus Brachybacter algidus TaxID=2982024 RepID=UPI001B6C6C6F|nr:MGMT family protein [Candidatus Brachybacter algidus]MBP7305793.1 MGMT family protein [Saprospiraceae bacterium]MBK6374430.1 MGMT family protein [Candidatus Brachybacter algidus]MBK6450753.1 MGMT family protein [Candidatus Brachybacter algidus]MBK7604865.1 MGMT family protein [Candidatus Brachybacter algidus]MBK8356251.1 MGMT family protein [Candidatus Brachybacter algidus]
MADHSYFQSVYQIVRLIPLGRVTTYGAIANALGLGSARMVGWALNHCGTEAFEVPAHRVVNRKGALTGQLHFSPEHTMESRLNDEGIEIKDSVIVSMEKYFWDPAGLSD